MTPSHHCILMKLIGYSAASFIDDRMNEWLYVSTLPIRLPATLRNSDQSSQQQHHHHIPNYRTLDKTPIPRCPLLLLPAGISIGRTDLSPALMDGKSPNWDFLFISWRSISSQSILAGSEDEVCAWGKMTVGTMKSEREESPCLHNWINQFHPAVLHWWVRSVQ